MLHFRARESFYENTFKTVCISLLGRDKIFRHIYVFSLKRIKGISINSMSNIFAISICYVTLPR